MEAALMHMSEAFGEEHSPDEPSMRNRFQAALEKIAQDPESMSDATMKTHRQWTDAELVTALVDRQRGAFAELYRRHQRSVGACSRRILKNEVQSDNVTIEIFIRFWLDPGSFKVTESTLLSFLQAQAKRRSNDLLLVHSPDTGGEANEVSRSPNRTTDMDPYAMTTPAAIQLRRALTLLPSDEREPIELAFFGGLSYGAIAKHLRLPIGMVRSRIHNGLQRLHSTCGTPSNWHSRQLILTSSANSSTWRRSSKDGGRK
jgi:RNA polymerase sigma-70 factor, ECF subfamily